MYNKKLRKVFAVCTAMMVLTIAAGAISASAANTEVNTVDPGITAEEKAAKADDPTTQKNIDPSAEDDPATADVNEAYTDMDMAVWGFIEEETEYSVDVEWGDMTFWYQNGSWDSEKHMRLFHRTWNTTTHKYEILDQGWKVYDNTNDEVLGDVQDAINRITITNHSNASVYAKLTYTSEEGYSDTTGSFAATDASKMTAENTAADVKATWNAENSFLTLQTSDDNQNVESGEPVEGAAAVGNVYFMPVGPSGATEEIYYKKIPKWTKIGKITVALSTTEPTEEPVEEPTA